MTSISLGALAALAREGADSVFRYVQRTAQETPEGVCWRTLTDAGGAQYRGDLYSNGGIPLFLADYARLTGNADALALGLRGAAWCSAPEREFLVDRFAGSDPWSLLGGRAGPGLAWLRLHQAARAMGPEAGEAAEALERAAAVGDALLERPPGPFTGLSMGAVGQGILLLRLWQQTRSERHLEGAVRRAEWLAEQAIRRDRGCYWPMEAGKPRSALTTICHGTAGVGAFLVQLGEATRDQRWVDLTRGAAESLAAEARPDRGGLNWLPGIGAEKDSDLDWKPVPPGETITRCQWCNGAPGTGLFFVLAYERLSDPAYLATAKAAGEATYAYGDGRANPTYCHGLAGNTELLIELYRVTGSARWLQRSRELAGRMLAYRRRGPEGETWPGDDPATSAPDFLCGAAGTGHVFLRLLDPHAVRMALL